MPGRDSLSRLNPDRLVDRLELTLAELLFIIVALGGALAWLTLGLSGWVASAYLLGAFVAWMMLRRAIRRRL